MSQQEQLPNKIEINCDMGEGFGRWKMGPDEQLMDYIDVANIACGFHAGDPSTMLKTVRLAQASGVKTGAHPGLQDLFGFGRRRIEVDPEDMYASILYQVGSLQAILSATNTPLNHIKPHGELFFYMHRDPAIMDAVLRAIKVFNVPVYGIPNPLQTELCQEMGIPFVHEFYPDIDYDREGRLVAVAKSKSATEEDVEERIRRVGKEGKRVCSSGEVLDLGYEKKGFSVCLHSDMPEALRNARVARRVVDELNAERAAAEGASHTYQNGVRRNIL